MWTLSPPTSPPAEGGAGALVLAVRTTSEWWRWPWWGARRDQWSERGERTVMGLTKQPSLSMTTSSVRKEREIFPTILQIISYSGIVSGYISYISILYNESWSRNIELSCPAWRVVVTPVREGEEKLNWNVNITGQAGTSDSVRRQIHQIQGEGWGVKDNTIPRAQDYKDIPSLVDWLMTGLQL